MAGSQKIFYECVVCVCRTIGTIFLLIVFFLTLGFLMGVLTISFALKLIYTNLFEIQKLVSLQRFSFKRY